MTRIDDSASNDGINFSNSLKTTIDNAYPGNTYDSGFLFGYSIAGIVWNTYIYVPHADSLDTTKKHYVIPHIDFTHDTVVAYYVNSLGNIDSIGMTEDMADTSYVWVVSAYSETTLPPSAPGSSCDEDHICEPDYGEDCSCKNDCKCDTPGNPTGTWDLTLVSIELLTDNKPYHENWLGGKYEISVAVITADPSTNTVMDHTDFYNVAQWKSHGHNAEVKRCKPGKCHGNNIGAKSINLKLSEVYDPNYDVYLLFSEYDAIPFANLQGETVSVLSGANVLHYFSKSDDPYGQTAGSSRFPYNYVYKVGHNEFTGSPSSFTYTGGGSNNDELSFTVKATL